MLNNIFAETSAIFGNKEAFRKSSSLSSELNKVKKKQINLNKLIHIFTHKAQYNFEHIHRKSNSSNMNTLQNIETELSGCFLTTNNKILTKNHTFKNIKSNHLNKYMRDFSPQKQQISYNRSIDSKVFPLMNSLFVRTHKREKENTHQRLKELNEREQQKRLLNAHKLKEKNNVLKENIMLMKSKDL